jgi:hypothetical protein
MRWIVEADPSAICSIALPCSAFADATISERLWVRSLLAMDKPAASSAAREIRRPDDSFRIALSVDIVLTKAFFDEFSAPTLVLIRMGNNPP